jgi:hypothetical protein
VDSRHLVQKFAGHKRNRMTKVSNATVEDLLEVIEVRIVGSPLPSDDKTVANRRDHYAYKVGSKILYGIARRPYPVTTEQSLID